MLTTFLHSYGSGSCPRWAVWNSDQREIIATYIDKIQSPNGEITNQRDIRKEIQDFFEDLYSNKEVDESDAALREFVSDLPKISADDKAILEENPTMKNAYWLCFC